MVATAENIVAMVILAFMFFAFALASVGTNGLVASICARVSVCRVAAHPLASHRPQYVTAIGLMAKWLDKYYGGFKDQDISATERVITFNYHPMFMTIGWLAFASEGLSPSTLHMSSHGASHHGVPRLPRPQAGPRRLQGPALCPALYHALLCHQRGGHCIPQPQQEGRPQCRVCPRLSRHPEFVSVEPCQLMCERLAAYSLYIMQFIAGAFTYYINSNIVLKKVRPVLPLSARHLPSSSCPSTSSLVSACTSRPSRPC